MAEVVGPVSLWPAGMETMTSAYEKDNPFRLLREQAELLAPKTEGHVEARVDFAPGVEELAEFRLEVPLTGVSAVLFYLVAPRIGTRVALFVALSDPAAPYPVRVIDLTGGVSVATDEAGLCSALSDIFRAEKTLGVIGRLWGMSLDDKGGHA